MNEIWKAAQAILVMERGVIVGAVQLEEEAPGVLSVESSAAGDSRWTVMAHALCIAASQFVEDPLIRVKLLSLGGQLVGWLIKEQEQPPEETFPF